MPVLKRQQQHGRGTLETSSYMENSGSVRLDIRGWREVIERFS